MAQFTVNAQRFDPYKNFKFRVRWDGKYVAGVSKVGTLKRTTEVVKHREGGDPSSSRKSPGRTEYDAITLERGVTHDVAFDSGPTRSGIRRRRWERRSRCKTSARTSPSKSITKPASWSSRIRFIAAGFPNTRPCPTSTPTPTPWRSAYQVGKRGLGAGSVGH